MLDGMPTKIEQGAVTASVGRFASARFGWSVTAGGIVAGNVGRGGTLGVQGSYLAAYDSPDHPFLAFTFSASGSITDADYSSFDGRIGATAGKAISRFVPYVALRLFGGPVFYNDASGGDRYHVTIGAGSVVRLPANLDATLEVMPLGERSIAVGVSLHR